MPFIGAVGNELPINQLVVLGHGLNKNQMAFILLSFHSQFITTNQHFGHYIKKSP